MNLDNKDFLVYEREYLKNGYKYICGVDEAGRGPLAGPVCAAAVIMDYELIIDGVNDSKKLSEKEIDQINILNATHLAMKRAVEALKVLPDFVFVDGNRLPDLNIPAKSIIKGDSLSYSIACASILAKVTRDRFMIEQSSIYPEYGFDKHKGYGTKYHVEMLNRYGPCPIHRNSFLKKVIKNDKQ